MSSEAAELPVAEASIETAEAVVAEEVDPASDNDAVAVEVDDASLIEDQTEHNEDEDDLTIKSQATDDDTGSVTSSQKVVKAKKSPSRSRSSKRSRPPSVAGLEIPFRTVKKAMKLDPEVPIVQTEAALMVTVAAELFVKSLGAESYKNAKARGRNVIRYEDVAEGRTKKASLSFLEPLLP